jgi:prevent-host-death family protein
MKRMPARAFKSRCFAGLREVQKSGVPVIVTTNGKPIAKIVPIESDTDDIFGSMAGECKIIGDIESPVWPVMRRGV